MRHLEMIWRQLRAIFVNCKERILRKSQNLILDVKIGFFWNFKNTLKLHEVAPWIEFGLNHHWSLISIKSSSSSTSRNSKIIISSYFLVCAVPCHFLSCTFTGVLHCPVCTLLSNPKKILFGIILFKNETGLIIFWNYSFLPSGCWTFLLWERSIFH